MILPVHFFREDGEVCMPLSLRGLCPQCCPTCTSFVRMVPPCASFVRMVPPMHLLRENGEVWAAGRP